MEKKLNEEIKPPITKSPKVDEGIYTSRSAVKDIFRIKHYFANRMLPVKIDLAGISEVGSEYIQGLCETVAPGNYVRLFNEAKSIILEGVKDAGIPSLDEIIKRAHLEGNEEFIKTITEVKNLVSDDRIIENFKTLDQMIERKRISKLIFDTTSKEIDKWFEKVINLLEKAMYIIQ
ncbi:MAG: hypothetical protein QXS37_04230 [Candidatus Aenigmatarchaeota archaeon]